MRKIFIDANTLLLDSFRLGEKILQADYRADFILGIWRGGTPTGIAIQQYLTLAGINSDHSAIRAASYYGIDQQHKEVSVLGLDYVVQQLKPDSKLLIIDDVFDSGRSIDAIINALQIQCVDNLPTQIRVACPWYKPKRSVSLRIPDFYLYETDDWLVFPHELESLSIDEIQQGKGCEIAELSAQALSYKNKH